MILTDTTPLVALVDINDPDHARCHAALKTLQVPILTTWPCMTEATYLLRREGGWPLVNALWQLHTGGILRVHIPIEAELQRAHQLMMTYQNTPCDLADASLIAAAETLGLDTILTFDSHFYAYRLVDGKVLIVVP